MSEPIIVSTFLYSYAASKALDISLANLSDKLFRKGDLLFPKGTSRMMIQALDRLAQEVTNWSNHMEYSHTGAAPDLSKLYIELDLLMDPVEVTEERLNRKIRLKQLLKGLKGHVILLGRPGSGKTTTLKAICYDFMRGNSPLMGFYPVPIVIRLREVNNTISIYDCILSKLAIEIKSKNQESEKLSKIEYSIKREIVLSLINEHRILLVLDGFDEISSYQVTFNGVRCSAKEMFVAELKDLCLNVTDSTVLLTSRTADFPYYVTGASTFELGRLTRDQVSKYIKQFFGRSEEAASAEAEIIDRKLLGSEYVPLTLSYLCILFKRYGRLFNSRREIYNKLLDLLLEDWDTNRQVKRTSSFADFDLYDKKKFLRHLAFDLSIQGSKSFFSQGQVQESFRRIGDDYPNLKQDEYKTILREIETHTGLFVRSGIGYIFSHETMREYLFALYLYEFPEIPKDKSLLIQFPNELAMATSFNENPTLYFAYLLMNRFDTDFYNADFLFPFLDRLMLEGTNFKVHSYLALSILIMLSNILTNKLANRGRQPFNNEDPLNYFFKFLNVDGRIEKSMVLISECYTIAEERPASNILTLKKIKAVDLGHSYEEPDVLTVSYDFYAYFVK